MQKSGLSSLYNIFLFNIQSDIIAEGLQVKYKRMIASYHRSRI